MVNPASAAAPEQAAARAVAGGVRDPEIRVVTIEELGILRDVTLDGGRVVVTITPTYSGCPAMDVIRQDIVGALHAAGHPDVEIRTALSPPWTTDWITPEGLAKLVAAGISPPPASKGLVVPADPARATWPAGQVRLAVTRRCPQCGSLDTERLSRFGSTACKSLWRCRACQEPFDAIKPL